MDYRLRMSIDDILHVLHLPGKLPLELKVKIFNHLNLLLHKVKYVGIVLLVRIVIKEVAIIFSLKFFTYSNRL